MFDEIEREALLAEGLDPDSPDTAAAIDLVRWQLSLLKNCCEPDSSQ